MKDRTFDVDDEFAETQVLPPPAADRSPPTEAEVEALYQAYLRACRDAGLEALPPRHRRQWLAAATHGHVPFFTAITPKTS
jgi:hypothetical protein